VFPQGALPEIILSLLLTPPLSFPGVFLFPPPRFVCPVTPAPRPPLLDLIVRVFFTLPFHFVEVQGPPFFPCPRSFSLSYISHHGVSLTVLSRALRLPGAAFVLGLVPVFPLYLFFLADPPPRFRFPSVFVGRFRLSSDPASPFPLYDFSLYCTPMRQSKRVIWSHSDQLRFLRNNQDVGPQVGCELLCPRSVLSSLLPAFWSNVS